MKHHLQSDGRCSIHGSSIFSFCCRKNISKADRTRYVAFIKFNAETLWRYGTDKQRLLFGTYWKTKPGDVTDLPTQLSGCMLIEAAALLEIEKICERLK